jgi:inhibitor of cysteine peptidase
MGEVSLTAIDSGGSRSVRVGDIVVISLVESPTSGFGWGVEKLPPQVTPAGGEFVQASEAGLGGSGTRVFRFEAQATGKGRLALRRWRSWEGEASVVERFDATIEVQP